MNVLGGFLKTMCSDCSALYWYRPFEYCLVLTSMTFLNCSIEFDRDDELFATAGVSRRIKVFNYATVHL